MAGMKCPKSSDGKHDWKVFRRDDPVFGKGPQHRKCQTCGYEEIHETDQLTGRSRGWKSV